MNRELPEEITSKLRIEFERLLKEYYGDNIHWVAHGIKGFPTYHLNILKDVLSWPNSESKSTHKVIEKQITVTLMASEYKRKGE